jgi:CPA1 family monovalent cation:H+ antiporter
MVELSPALLFAGLAAALTTLAARALTVGLPFGVLRRRTRLPAGSAYVLTWAGVRGGISVALALSLPVGPERDAVLALTYCVVVFSILVQGLTIGRVTRKTIKG